MSVSLIENSLLKGTCMNPHNWLERSRLEAPRSVRKPSCSIFLHTHLWITGFVLLIVCVGALGQSPAGKEEYVRQSAPQLLTFDELVQLEKTDDPSPELAARLDQLLHTPFLSNEEFFAGAKPNRPSSEALGPFLRATTWGSEKRNDVVGGRPTRPSSFLRP